MGIKSKLVGAVTFWTNPTARRIGILGSCLAYSGGIVLIGCIYLALVATGTFPAPVYVLVRAHMYSLYLAKYSLYIVSGVVAWVGGHLAIWSLRRNKKSTGSQLLLALSAAAVLASAVLTVVALIMSAAQAPKWFIYLIEIIIIIVRLLFASTLIMAVWTLMEADKDPAIAQMMLTHTEGRDMKMPVTQPAQPHGAAYLPPPPPAAANGSCPAAPTPYPYHPQPTSAPVTGIPCSTSSGVCQVPCAAESPSKPYCDPEPQGLSPYGFHGVYPPPTADSGAAYPAISAAGGGQWQQHVAPMPYSYPQAMAMAPPPHPPPPPPAAAAAPVQTSRLEEKMARRAARLEQRVQRFMR